MGGQKYLYLIQGKAERVSTHSFLNSDSSDIRGLTYDLPMEGFDYLPDSSFAQGRNHQYQIAQDNLGKYDYFIFIDDDISFVRGSFSQMEQNLARHRPSIGVPVTEKTRNSVIGLEYKNKIYPFAGKQRFFLNDEQYIAVNNTVIEEGKIFPYLEDWDEKSWFVCCLIQEALIQIYYKGEGLQFNNCEIKNNIHSGEYPHNLDFAVATYRSHMMSNYPRTGSWTASYDLLFTLEWSPQKVARSLHKSIRNYLGRTYRLLDVKQACAKNGANARNEH